jgi:hypothetical protein
VGLSGFPRQQRIVGRVVFYAVCVESKEIRDYFLPEFRVILQYYQEFDIYCSSNRTDVKLVASKIFTCAPEQCTYIRDICVTAGKALAGTVEAGSHSEN